MRSTLRIVTFVFIGAWSTASVDAQQVPLRISSDEALRHLEKQVEPPPVTTVPGNAVTADLIIALDGNVESVRIIEGHSVHTQPAIEAFKQWKFSPFTKDGRIVRAIVKLALYVPDAPPSKEPALTVNASQLLEECTRLVNSRDFAGGESACTRALAAANSLRTGAVLERSSAHAWLGHALLFQGRPREALAQYTQELALVERVLKSNDAEVASAYRHVGLARFALGEVAVADQHLARAATIMEAALVNLPSEKSRYQAELGAILREHAQVKRALGDETSAVALEKKAAELAQR